MNIKGLTLNEISQKIREYLPPFIRQYKEDENLFQESFQFEFDEIKNSIPQDYHKHFKDNDIINAADGNIENDEHDYTVALISNGDYSKAYLLILQKENKDTGDTETEVIKSFL